jgi:hypothetical protein
MDSLWAPLEELDTLQLLMKKITSFGLAFNSEKVYFHNKSISAQF